jgi:hypothetical protein
MGDAQEINSQIAAVQPTRIPFARMAFKFSIGRRGGQKQREGVAVHVNDRRTVAEHLSPSRDYSLPGDNKRRASQPFPCPLIGLADYGAM